ncbi:bleomycin hydrolase [Tilletia horrida]|uniref:Bleomycin hydrolase n=1 Tax=Tilletia horrida TaxID=155126 RepID=A0AAN6GTU3_9BASI|nr:bleomycin hydrolase [Tilletia horrida]KAK0567816.1 bleomycin hydrolase [Tilletia horrida]
MGANISKDTASSPAAAPTASRAVQRLNEKIPAPTASTTYANASASLHHSADRLNRIEAESHYAATNNNNGSSGNHRDRKVITSAQVTMSSINSWSKAAFELPTSRLASMVLHNADINTSLHSRAAEIADTHVFNIRIPEEGRPVVNQRSSGRCWLFALTNCIRLEVIKKFDLPEFELSQSYLHWWDKLEKSNYFLENMIDLIEEPLDSRLVNYLLQAPVNDGGQWDMSTNLVVRYGVIPKHLFPESWTSSNTGKFNQLLTAKLREYALELRDLRTSTLNRTSALSHAERDAAVLSVLRTRKEAQMAEVYRMLAIAYGEPPKPDDEITFEFVDKKGKFHSITTTPVQFQIEHTGTFTAKGSLSLVHDPRREPGNLITVSRLGNIVGMQPVLYVLSTPKLMKEAVIRTLKAGFPVFCGSDFGHGVDSKTGIMDPKLIGVELAFNIKLGMSKEERINTGESQMTHATVITAVHLDQKTGKPIRWRIENSWGADVGEKGYFVMTDAWFDEWIFQVVIRKEFARPQDWAVFQKGVVEGETESLPPYDPFGALA